VNAKLTNFLKSNPTDSDFVRILDGISRDSSFEIRDLITALDSEDFSEVCSAFELIIRINKNVAYDNVNKLITHQNETIRCYLIGQIDLFVPKSDLEDFYIKFLRDVSGNVKWNACNLLAEYGSEKCIEHLELISNTDTDEDYEGRLVSDEAKKALTRIRTRL
jgi:hypothetical protein